MKQNGIFSNVLLPTILTCILISSATVQAETAIRGTSTDFDQKYLPLDDGSITFINEDFDGEPSVGILEQGKIDLTSFYTLEATALEIYLAFQPKEEAPQFLIDAHFKKATNSNVVSYQPRDLSELAATTVSMGPGYYNFSKDTNNCWGWGGVSNYNSGTGSDPSSYNGHSQSASQTEFTNWSMITGTSVLKGEYTSNGIYLDEHAESGDRYYATGFANERAFAMCVVYATVQYDYHPSECSLVDGISENSVNYSLKLFVESASGATWNSKTIKLEAYGEGMRYRSSSNTKRRYNLRVIDKSIKSNICTEKYDVFWRAKTYIGTPDIGEYSK